MTTKDANEFPMRPDWMRKGWYEAPAKPTRKPRAGFKWDLIRVRWVDSDGGICNYLGQTFGHSWQQSWFWEWRQRKIQRRKV